MPRRRELEESGSRGFQAAFAGDIAAQMPVAARGKKMRALEFRAEHFADRFHCLCGREIFRHIPRRVSPNARNVAAFTQLDEARVQIAQRRSRARRLAERELHKSAARQTGAEFFEKAIAVGHRSEWTAMRAV